jgi:hypothetical protein
MKHEPPMQMLPDGTLVPIAQPLTKLEYYSLHLMRKTFDRYRTYPEMAEEAANAAEALIRELERRGEK